MICVCRHCYIANTVNGLFQVRAILLRPTTRNPFLWPNKDSATRFPMPFGLTITPSVDLAAQRFGSLVEHVCTSCFKVVNRFDVVITEKWEAVKKKKILV